MSKRVVFKPYSQQQLVLLPPSLEDLISANHPVRVVNEVIEQLDISKLEANYAAGGCSSYHPKMLLKVLVYGYLHNTYSSRKLEAAIQENIHFMWLAAMNRPDHHTINRFRGVRLKEHLKDIFVQVVKLLAQSGHIGLQEVYVDGTKIEANANRYTFVWGKSIKTNKAKMEEQLKALWAYAEEVGNLEQDDDTPTDFTPTDSKKIKETIATINKALAGKEQVSKAITNKLKYAEAHWPAALDKYAEQEKILDGRNSYSKTDEDATFMRMKEDHMQNGQLKPGYNVQISTEQQIITNYSIHPNPTDTKTFIPHLEQFAAQYGKMPKVAIADAGYGSEQNLQYLNEHHIESYVKYSQFDREQNNTIQRKKPFAVEHLFYNKQKNIYICPMGQPMQHIGTFIITSDAGYNRTIDKYQAKDCSRCPLNGVCHKSKNNRTIEVSHQGNDLKQQTKQNLQSEQGIYYRKKRCIEPEPVFANIKHNKKFKRFMLKGKEKVSIELGLLSIAHNLAKIAA
jgi:transposase